VWHPRRRRQDQPRWRLIFRDPLSKSEGSTT
jgi:hypothetical protein